MSLAIQHLSAFLHEHARDEDVFQFAPQEGVTIQDLKEVLTVFRAKYPETKIELVESADAIELKLSPDPSPETLMARINKTLEPHGLEIASLEMCEHGDGSRSYVCTMPEDQYGMEQWQRGVDKKVQDAVRDHCFPHRIYLEAPKPVC